MLRHGPREMHLDAEVGRHRPEPAEGRREREQPEVVACQLSRGHDADDEHRTLRSDVRRASINHEERVPPPHGGFREESVHA